MIGRSRARSAILAAAGALVAVLTGATGAIAATPPAGSSAHSAPVAASRTPLRHVVVMAQLGHTFDNYLGTRPGVDGFSPRVCVPGATASSPCVSPHPISGSPHAALALTVAGRRTAVAGGRMDGFVRAQALYGASGRVAMGYYPAAQLPILTGLADRGVVFDHWFAAAPGGSIAGDLFAVSAYAPGDPRVVPAHGWGDTPLIFDRLRAAGVSWRVYVENYDPHTTIRIAGSAAQRTQGQLARVPLLAETRWLGAPLQGHVVSLSRYYDDLADGGLPQVAFVVTTQHTESPPQAPATGQAVVRDVTNALLGSSAGSDSVLFLTYADSGGWYDHVVPVAADGAARGLRVPAVAISPYLRPGRVDHTVLDSAAILRLIEANWGLAPLTSRDANAPNLLRLFSFRDAPRPTSLVGVVASSPSPHQPDRAMLYAGYLLVLLLGAAFAGALLRWTRTRAPVEERP